ncbi:hypothetical protein J2127_000001, partial [Methanococcus voltae]|uniref:CARDB domain-containing protein n=1 Tax=Methanococcus voltae TaxID=2188 RepID=UPI001AE2ABC6
MKNSKINSKSKLKIIIMSLMAIFVVFGSLGACSAATDANIVVSLAPQTQHVCDGQQVQMDIWVNNSNITVEGFESTIAYDSNNLKLVDIQLSDVANTAGLKDANVAGNSISLAWIGGGITETSFKIATLTFNTSNISTNEVLLRNIDMTKDGGVSTTPISEHILGANVRVLGYYPNILEVTVLPELIYEGIVTLDVDSKLINPGFANESMSVNFSLNDKNYTMNYDATSKSFKVQIPDLVLDASTLNGKVSAQYVEKVAQQDVSIVVNTPDIAIGEITVDNPYYSTPAKITVPVSNEGSVTLKDTASYTISVYADSTLLKTENIRPLVAGETQEIIVDWTAEKPSTKIIAELSFDDENISNNKVLKTIDVTENTISVNLTENKSLVTVDEYFNITIDLNKLDGVRTVNGFEFILNFDKNLVMCENSTFLIPESDINLKLIDIDNNNGIIRYSIVIDGITNNMPIVKAKFKALNSGNSTFELTNVSISDKTSEFNNVELNNAKVEIISSDIGINAIIPDSYNIGQKVTLDVDVTNNGHVDITKPFKVSLYVDANNPIEKTINSLQVGATETIQFEWANNAKITTLLTIIADDSNAVSEENESNNRLSKSVKIVDDAINVYTAKKDPNEKGFIFTLNAKDVAEYRKCAGFEGTLNLKNLVVKDQMLSGTFSNYNAETGYFGGFNFTENKYGEFELANFVLEIVNTSKPYVVNITNIELSDEQSNSYGNVTFNTTSILGGVILRSPENVGGENVVVNSNGNIVEYVGGEIIWSPATEKMPAGNRIGIQIVGPEGVDTSNSKIKIGDVESKWDDVKGIDNTLCYYLIVNEENKKFTITAVWNNVSNQVFNITVDDAVILDSPIAIESVTPEEGAKLSGSFDISVTLSEVASKYSAIIDEKTANEKIVTLTPKDTTYTGNVTGITSGAHTLKINVSESNGNKAVKTISFTVDAEAPTITLTPINGTIVNEGSLEVTAVLNEGSITSASLDDVAVEFEAVEGQENTYTATIETVAGNKNNLTVVAQDNLGNEATEEVIYVVDAEAPTITLTPINGTIVNEGSLEVTAVLNEGSITSASLDDVAVEFKAVEDQENTYTATIETVAGNKNNLTVVAQDNLGNEATEEVIYVV